MARIFVNGGTGYIGRPLIENLLRRGHDVKAVVRTGSAKKLPPGAEAVIADALDASTYRDQLKPDHTFIQLVGVPHPSPAKAREFPLVDGRSAREAIAAAQSAHIAHFVYISVAHPAPVMKAYIDVRSGCEVLLRDAGLRATIFRPWYVLGPGHRWPVALMPFYWMAERVPKYAEAANRLGLVSLDEVVRSLVRSIEQPPEGLRVLEPPAIRVCGRNSMSP